MPKRAFVRDKKVFSERLKELKKESDLSLNKISEILREHEYNISPATLSGYCNESTAPPGEGLLNAIAEYVFEVNPEYLTGDTDVKNIDQAVSMVSHYVANTLLPLIRSYFTMCGVVSLFRKNDAPKVGIDEIILAKIAVCMYEKKRADGLGLCLSPESYWEQFERDDFVIFAAKKNEKKKREDCITIINGDVLLQKVYEWYKVTALQASDFNEWINRNAEALSEEAKREGIV